LPIYKFINNQKEKYFKWLYNLVPEQFPRICDLASDILSSYLLKNYPNDDIKFIRGKFDCWSHYWVEVNDKILDFTIIQFFNNSDRIICFNYSAIKCFQLYFEPFHNSPFIPEIYYNKYKKYEEFKPSYVGNDYDENFDKYLKQIENIIENCE